MNFLNEAQSIRFFQATQASPVWRPIARLGSSFLIWVMVIFLFGYTRLFFWIPLLLLPWGVTLLLSSWIRRPRPYQKQHFVPIMRPVVETSSFPSEHATLAFAIAALFFIGNMIVFFPYMLLAAILVAVSRVACGVHYFSDVLAGAAIGFILSIAGQVAMFLLVLYTHSL